MKLHFLYKNPLFTYFLCSMSIFLLLAYLYEPITLGFNHVDTSTLLIPTLGGLFLLQYFIGTSLIHRGFLGHGTVGFLWALTFPLLFHWSYTKPFYFYEFANDYLFGLLTFLGLVICQYTLLTFERWPRVISFFFAIIDFLLALIPLGQIGYYIITWHCLTPSSLMALYMTNPKESIEFIYNAAGLIGSFFLIIGLLFLLYFFYWSNKGLNKVLLFHVTTKTRRAILCILSLSYLIYVPLSIFPKTDIIANWFEIRSYMQELQKYNDNHQGIYQSLDLYTKATSADKVPGTIILVIGESSSRNYMKVYNPSFPYDDTPWQSEERKNPHFIFFNKAYSSYVQTVPTLERALTERNQYNDKPFLQSSNILDVAKKAGYHTIWLSNQGVYGEYDTAISLIAKTADTAKWAHESYMFSDKYDEHLLPLLKEVSPQENNFIVIHIMGSHIYYNDRYPHEFSKWKKGSVPQGMEAYANSQLYTDHVLKEIFTYAKEHLHLQAMIYFSDHGESLHLSHNPDVFDFDMTRIPFWIYLSPNYEKAYPKTVTLLRSRENQYFTNDLLYDFLSGIMKAPSNRYDKKRDFSNDAYGFTVNNLTTMLGTQPLTNDPNR